MRRLQDLLNRPKPLSSLSRGTKQRLAALFLLVIFVVSLISPTASLYAASNVPQQRDVNPIKDKDATYKSTPQVERLAPVSEKVAAESPAHKKFDIKTATKKDEKVGDRTTQSRTYDMEGGGELTETTALPQNYRAKDGQLKPINTRPERDAEYEEANKVTESFWQRILPGSEQPVGYKAVQGSIEVYFETIGMGGIRVIKDGHELQFAPDTNNTVKPQLKQFDNGEPYILYQDVWPKIDLYYAYQGTSLKEYIRINQNTGQNSFGFNLTGAKAVKDQDGKVTFDGEFAGLLVLGDLSVNVNKQGPLQEAKPAYVVSGGGQALAVTVDGKWLNKQNGDAFPMVIDPPLWDNSYIPGGYTGQFWDYKSDGYYCSSSNCNINIGRLYQSGAGPRSWRTMFVTPYEHIFGRQVLGAWIDMSMTNAAGWAGYYDNRTVWVTWAPCFGFGCTNGGAPQVSGVIGGSGTIDVTPLMNWLQTNNVHGGVLIAWGEEWHDTSYKQIHPLSVVLRTATNLYPSIPAPQAPSTDPSSEVVVTSTQSMLGVSTSNDPNGDPVKYVYQLRSSNGVVLYQTDWMDANRLTIPEGLLQDGGSYAWSYAVWDGWWSSPWQNGGKFRVDLRTGKDKTSTYQTLGPVSVSLNNGNVYTSVDSHSIKALDGGIGLSLNYNSPLASRNGVRAEYFNNTTLSGDPVLRRTEATIDNTWSTGTPAQNVVSVDNFSSRYKGYFVAPVSGDYYFGANNDDQMTIKINNQQVYNDGGCWPGPCYGSTIALAAGQTVPIEVTHIEYGGAATARVFVKGPVAETIIKTEWLKTEPMPTDQNIGLTGSYYADDGSHNPAQLAKIMTRQDPSVNFQWGTLAPVSGLQADNYFVRWEGYYTPPTTGAYTFGAAADDGVRVKINGATVMENWAGGAFPLIYGTNSVFLTAGVPVPISVEYFELNGGAYAQLYAKGPSNPNGGIVEPQYLSPGGKVLPAGWNISADADGNLVYERLSLRQNGDVILYDADGTEHLYATTGTGYKPPVNEDAVLVRNADGSYSLTDTDGRIYVFNVDGTLRETQTPIDDRKPAAIKYNYATQNGIPKLTEIVDGVDTTRKGNLYYQGDSQCAAPPSGYVAPDTSNLCAFVTSDGQRTDFLYTQNPTTHARRLARVSLPGGAKYDFGYDNNGMLVSVRDVSANDAVAAGVRSDDTTVLTEIAYADPLARATSITTPAPTAGAVRNVHSLEYLPGKSKLHVSGAAEPNGYTQYIEYDDLLRTTKACDVAALCDTTEWNATKDIVLSGTDETGLKSTTIYDDEDRPTDSYGPAPAAWFGADRKPTSTYVNQVPHTQTNYDEGMVGAAVSYYGYKSGSLVGAPRLHTTGTVPEDPGFFNKNWSTSPITINAANGETGFGFRASGKLRVPSANTYYFSLWHNDGVRMYIDDQLVVNDWVAGAVRGSNGSKYLETGKSYRFLLEYFDADGQGAGTDFYISPGSASTAPAYRYWTSYLSPDYSLTTSSKVFDSQTGDVTNTTNYGSRPELSQVNSIVEDSGVGGQNLTTGFTYEPYQTGSLMRQTSKTLPGGNTFTYNYYGATEAKANPCDANSPSVSQAGMPKGKAEPDPDGAGSQTSRTTETVYNAAGQVVATRYNNDSWTCTTYDARGRITATNIPARGTYQPARTITNNYAVSGNPLVVSTADSNGTMYTTSDLLGRTVSYTDAQGNTTTTTYDAQGRLVSRSGPLGEESFTYDTYDRLIDQKLDSIVYAHVTYDAYSRIDNVTYPNANDTVNTLRLTLSRDSLGRLAGQTYNLVNANSQAITVSDTVTRSVTGDILSGTENGLSKSYTYDRTGRLANAAIGSNTYAYDYSAPTAAQCAQTSANLNAYKNSNRTSMIVNGVTTTYCYDYADRLISSSDSKLSNPVYDDHGNVIQMGPSNNALRTPVDASDRSRGIEQYDDNGNGKAVYYARDAQNRINYRETNNIVNWDWILVKDAYYGFTGSGDTPDFVRNGDWDIVEKYLQLPGGVLLTIRPPAIGNSQKTYSLPNIHGDTMATTNASGALISTYTTGPFGEQIIGQTTPTNSVLGTTYQYVGQHEKLTETDFSVQLVQMGARVYVPSMGRFLQVDPIEGGTDNNYAYVSDPVNDFDLDGTIGFKKFFKDHWRGIAQVGIVTAAVAAGALCTVATAGACGPIAVAAIGAASGAASNLVGQVGNGKKFNVGSLALDTALGGALGGVGGKFAANAAFMSKKVTEHAAKQILGRDSGRGVSVSAVRNAYYSGKYVGLKVDSIRRWSQQVIGKGAGLARNSAGKVITAWPTSSRYYYKWWR